MTQDFVLALLFANRTTFTFAQNNSWKKMSNLTDLRKKKNIKLNFHLLFIVNSVSYHSSL